MLEAIKVKLDNYAFEPTRAHEWDAGLDLKTPVAVGLFPRESLTINTGVHIEIPEGYVGMLKSKSGLNVNDNIVSEGVIDAGYDGAIVVKLYNHGNKMKRFEPGDKISQLVIMPVETPKVIIVDEIDGGDRGSNGFGSTGR